MAKNAKTPAKTEEPAKWVSCTLSDAQTSDMKKNLPDWEAVGEQLQNLLDSGYKFTVNVDKFNKCLSAYVFPLSEENENYGSILTARGATVFSSLRGAVYRHFGVFSGQWATWTREEVDKD